MMTTSQYIHNDIHWSKVLHWMVEPEEPLDYDWLYTLGAVERRRAIALRLSRANDDV